MKNQFGYTIFFFSAAIACWALRMEVEQKAFAFTDERLVTSPADLVEPMVDSGEVAGLSVGIVSLYPSGKLKTETFHFGKATRNGLPTDETLYEIGGITNVFTGILLASAVTKGEVTLDTSAKELMPTDVKMPNLDGQEVTLLDLVTHRSGLPRIADNMPMSSINDPYSDYTSQLANQFLNGHKLTHVPDTHHEYSNFAMAYLGHLLARTPGAESYPDYDAMLKERLTGPLGMNATKVQLDDSKALIATGHTQRGKVAQPWTNADMPGAGGIHSSIADMNRFMAAQLKSPNDETGDAIDLAFAKQVDSIAGDFAMGLGWFLARDGATRWHNGRTGGFSSAMFVSRKLNLGICVLSNTASDKVTELVSRLFRFQAETSSRDGAGYPRLSPFSAVRWSDELPEVQVDAKWYRLVSLNDLALTDILAFSQKRYDRHWQKRFDEDLVELLVRMGHPPQRRVKLVLKPLNSEVTYTLKNVEMTEENRSAIYKAALSR